MNEKTTGGETAARLGVRTHLELTAIGGFGYNLIEILWRGHTHWSMFLLGGACFELMGCVHRRMTRTPLALRGAVCALGVTALELLCGCIVNLHFHWDVWDYSSRPFNILGQICPLYTAFWYFLGLAAAPIYRGCCTGLLRLHARLTEGHVSARGH